MSDNEDEYDREPAMQMKKLYLMTTAKSVDMNKKIRQQEFC